MNNKLILLSILLLLTSIPASAVSHEILDNVLYFYEKVNDVTISCGTLQFPDQNPNKTICINSSVITASIQIISKETYSLDYEMIYDLNDSHYVTRIVTINQTVTDSGWLGFQKDYHRVLRIDGNLIYEYDVLNAFLPKGSYFLFSMPDNHIMFGDEVIKNQTLVFTQMNMYDQYALINTTGSGCVWRFSTFSVLEDNTGIELKGFTGFISNALGYVPIFGKGLQDIVYLPMLMLQYVFDFTFTFLNIIVNNWWYALMTYEVMCIIPALMHRSYPELVMTYIKMHSVIAMFVYHRILDIWSKVIIPVLSFIRSLIPFA